MRNRNFMSYLEFAFEDGRDVSREQLEAGNMPPEDYRKAHANFVIPCHDVVIRYKFGGKDGALLVMRRNYPFKDVLWPIGGRIERGLRMEESLRRKVRKESGLELYDIAHLGRARTLSTTDPFGHGKGTDTINEMFFARGKGRLKLDKLHSEPRIVTPDEYRQMHNELHPYVQYLMDEIIAAGFLG